MQAVTHFAQARQEADRSLAVGEELAVLGEQGLTTNVLGAIAAAEGMREEAIRHFERAIDLLKGMGDNYGMACAQLSLAEVKIGRRDYRLRIELLNNCLPVFERLGAAIELERAQTLLEALKS